MSDALRLFPDHAWFDGKIASWEGESEGGVRLFEVIGDPQTFREIVKSSGNPEHVELYDPKPGQILRLTLVDENDEPVDREPVVLDINNPATLLQRGDRFVMDATETTALGHLAYTCFCEGVEEL